jgi:hypothetical protein
MPRRVTKLKGGKVRVKTLTTGKVRRFKSMRSYKHWKRVADAYDHGWKPKRKRSRK